MLAIFGFKMSRSTLLEATSFVYVLVFCASAVYAANPNALVFYVAPWSNTAQVKPKGNCRNDKQPCPSLKDALSMAMKAPPTASVSIQLLSDIGTQCKVLLHGPRDKPVGVTLNAFRGVKLEINGSRSVRNCSRTLLVPPPQKTATKYATRQKKRYLLVLFNLKNVTIRDVILDISENATASWEKHLQGLVHIHNSSLIKFVGCELRAERKRNLSFYGYGANTDTSHHVVFDSCTFTGDLQNFRIRRDTLIYDRKRPFKAIGRVYPMLQVGWCTERQPDVTGAQHFVCGAREKASSSCVNSSRPPHILVTNCAFSTSTKCPLTLLYPRSSILTQRRVDSNKVVGQALNIEVPLSGGRFVEVHATNFTNICSLFDVTTQIKFTTHLGLDVSSLVTMTGCNFQKNIARIGGGLMVSFPNTATEGPRNSEPHVIVSKSYFTDNHALQEGGAVAIRGWTRFTPKGQIIFDTVVFQGNKAKWLNMTLPGGAIAVNGRGRINPNRRGPRNCNTTPKPTKAATKPKRTRPKPMPEQKGPVVRKSLYVKLSNVRLENNTGFGCFLIGFARAEFTNTSFEGNHFSAIVADQAYLTFKGSLKMRGNWAVNGGAFRLRSFSKATLQQVDHLVIENNAAKGRGSVVFVDQESSALTLNRALLSNPSEKILQRMCPFILPNMSSEEFLTLFPSNRLEAAIFMGSLITCRSTYQHLLSALYSSVENPRYCMPYGPAVWDMTEERVGCDRDYCQVLEQFKPNGTFLEGCANKTSVLDRPNCHVRSSLGAELNQTLVWKKPHCLENIKFETVEVEPSWARSTNNTDCSKYRPDSAAGTGDLGTRTIYGGVCPVHRASACEKPNSYLLQPKTSCYSQRQRLIVVNRPPTGEEGRLTVFASLPAWLVFQFATTACYKLVGDEVWYFGARCYRSDIYARILNSTDKLHLQTDPSLMLLSAKLNANRRILMPVLPGYLYVVVPWASLLHRWNLYDVPTDDKKSPDVHLLEAAGIFPVKAKSISSLTLHPAPGEMFSLQVAAFDELMNPRGASLSIKVVSSNESRPIFLGHVNYVIHPGRSQVFFSADTISNLSLYGLPGSEGRIEVRVNSEISLQKIWDKSLVLSIPIRMRRCHLGFQPFGTTEEEAKELHRKFSGQVHNLTHISGQVISKLSCRCWSELNKCVATCHFGRVAYIHRKCWAGNKYQQPPLAAVPGSFGHDRTWFKLSVREFDKHGKDPIGDFDQAGKPFAANICPRSQCSPEIGNRSVWRLCSDDPCANRWCNCGGPLCGLCKPGFKLSMDMVSCVDCSKRPSVPIGVYFFLLFLANVVIFTALLFFNIGVTPALDIWLFFSQAFYCIHQSNYYVKAAFHNILTYGLGSLCATGNVSNLIRILGFIVGPFYILLILIAIYVAARRSSTLGFLQRLQHRNSVRHVFWLLILWTHCVLASVAVSLLRCTNLAGREVLTADPTVQCFRGEHLPFAVLGGLILLLVVLPPPILLIWRPTHIWPALTGFFDEAMHIFESSKPWWASLNVLRRAVFAMSYPVIRDSQYRRIVLCFYTGFLLVVHGYVRPYHREARLWKIRDADNTMEFIMLFILFIMSTVRIVHLDVYFVGHGLNSYVPLVVYCISSMLPLGVYTYRFARSWRATLQQKSRQSLADLWDSSVEESTFGKDALRRRRNRLAAHVQQPTQRLSRHLVLRSPRRSTERSSNSSGDHNTDSCTPLFGTPKMSSSNLDQRGSVLREPLLLDEMIASTERSLQDATMHSKV